MTVTQYNAQRKPGREHIPLYPSVYIVLRIIQLAFAFIALGLTAYAIGYFMDQTAYDGRPKTSLALSVVSMPD